MYKVFIFLCFFLFTSVSLFANEEVTIQLKWKHSFQFAGYYAAIEKGYYADEGLDVRLREIDLSSNYIDDVLSGKATYGVSDSSLVIAREQNKPVVLISQIFQYSPLVFISHKESNITTPYDMIGKKVMSSLHGSGDAPLRALLLKTLGSLDKVKLRDFTTYQDFIDRKVDVTSAYSTSQPYWLKQQGIKVNIIDPKSYGIDFYGDNFFTTQHEVQMHSQRVAKMRRATLRGWEYALAHPDEMIDIIARKYSPSMSRDVLLHQAYAVYQLIMPDLTDLGSFEKSKYEKVAKIYKQLGILHSASIDEAFFYQPKAAGVKLSAEEKAWIAKHPVVKVGGGPDWAPFDFVNSDGKYSGIANDYLKLVSEKTGLQFEVLVDKWSNNLQKMKNHKIDLLHAVYYTPERAKYMHYTRPYFEMLDYFFVRDDLNVTTLEDLNGKRVAIPKGYAHGDIVQKAFPKIKIVWTDTFSDAIDAVLQKRADMLFDTYASLAYILKRDGISTIVPFKAYRGEHTLKLHMAANADEPLLAQIVDKALAHITQEEKDAISRKWLFHAQNNDKRLKLSEDERLWLQQYPKATVAGHMLRLPFEAFDEEGNYIGIIADYLHEIEKMLPITFKMQMLRNYADKIKLARASDVDIVTGDMGDVLLERNYRALTPYFSAPVVIMMAKEHHFVNDLEDIKEKRIAVIKGYGYTNALKKAYPDISFLEVDNIPAALEGLKGSEKYDALLLSMPVAAYLIRTQGLYDIKVVGKTSVLMRPTLYVNKKKPQLYVLLDKALQNMDHMKTAEILGKWQKVEFAEKVDYKLLFQIAGMLGMILLGTLYWNRKLSKEIAHRQRVEKALARAKEEAEYANKAKSEFLTNMSHEIRTPMNAVLGFSQLLQKQIKDPVQKDYLDSITRGGETLLEIINDILDLSKIESGKVEITPESLDLRQLVLEMESVFRVKMVQKNLYFQVDIDPALPKYVMLDSVRIRQILFNLIGNAVKFTQEGGITLRVQQQKAYENPKAVDILISVEDTGIGIKPQYLETIFNAFEQQKGQGQKYGGTGLGLAICRKLLSFMDGEISVESKENEGSVFKVVLHRVAVSDEEMLSVRKEGARVHDIAFEKATVLIADDIADNRKLISSIVSSYGINVVEAVNGKDVLERLRHIKVDLIFLDLKMPVMDGYETIQALRSDPSFKKIPVVAVTASVMGEESEKVKHYDFDGYLRKPVSFEEVVSECVRFLPSKAKTDENPDLCEVTLKKQGDISKLVEILQREYLPEHKAIKDKGDFALISAFAGRLEELAKRYRFDFLVHYAKELQENCKSFDIEKVDFLMNDFVHVIEKLKERSV